MRWFWIDRFTKFVRQSHASAIKNVTLAEEHLHDYFPGASMMPNTLVLEGMAQTAGLLVADAIDYQEQVVLAKVGSAEFQFDVLPGDTLLYQAEIVEMMAGGSIGRVTSRVGNRQHGEAELYFGHVSASASVPRLFHTDGMLRWLDSLRIFDVAVNMDGSPIIRNENWQG